MNELIPLNGKSEIPAGRHIVITESVPGQWNLDANVAPLEVFQILLEIAKNVAVRQLQQNQSKIEVPQMQVTLQ